MPLLRPKMTRQTSAPPDLPMAAAEVSRNNTLRTLENLQKMGYRSVWVRCDDLSQNVLSIAWSGGWRVCDAKGNQVRLTLDSISPPGQREQANSVDDFEAPRIVGGSLQTGPMPPQPSFVTQSRPGGSQVAASYPAQAPAPGHSQTTGTPEAVVFNDPFAAHPGGHTPPPRASSRSYVSPSRPVSPLVPIHERRAPSPSTPLASPGLSRGSRVFGHTPNIRSPGGITPSAHLSGRTTPSVKIQSPDASRPSTILSEESIGYFNFQPVQAEQDLDALAWVPSLAQMGDQKELRNFTRPESSASAYSVDAEESEDSFGFDARRSSDDDETRTIRFDTSTPTIMLTGLRRPSAPTFIALPSPDLVRSDRMGSDPTGVSLRNRPAMRIKWPNITEV